MLLPTPFLLGLSLFLSSSFGAPTYEDAQDLQDPQDSQDSQDSLDDEVTISAGLLNKFELYEQYAAAAYCPRNFEANPDRKLRCPVSNCPRVEAADTSVIYSFASSSLTDTSGYVALDLTNSLIIVAFRGSESFRNYLTFLDFPLIPIELCVGCLSAKGYWTAWREVRDDILKAVKETHEEYPNFKVVSTGHSLGGAVATFAVAELRDQGHYVDLSTFGAPRIGNAFVVDYITAQTPAKGRNYRIHHVGDPTSSFPLTATGYRHLSPEYYITSNNEDRPTVEDVVRRETDEDGEGLLFTNFVEGNKAHDFYFGPISTCYEGGLLPPW